MIVRPTGVTMIAECELQLGVCVAREPRPITAVFPENEGRQVNVCRACLEQMVRSGDWEVPGARVQKIADIVVYDNSQRAQVVVEIKKAPTDLGADIEDWAFRVHRNMLTYQAVPFTTFFWLVATSGQFFLWKHQDRESDITVPDYSGNLKETLSAYLNDDDTGDNEKAVTNAVVRWFVDMKANGYPGQVPDWMSETGLLNLLQTGEFQTEVRK